MKYATMTLMITALAFSAGCGGSSENSVIQGNENQQAEIQASEEAIRAQMEADVAAARAAGN